MVETTYHLGTPVSIALLTDLHGHPYSNIISSVAARRPSFICLAGDFIYGTWPEGNISPLVSQTNVLPFFRACALVAPTYLSLGNHERILDEKDIGEIGRTGVTVLDNEWVEKDGIIIGGLTSAYVTDYRRAAEGIRTGENRYPKKEPMEGTASEGLPDTSWLAEYADVPGYHILLSHHPEYFPLLPPSIELTLSGHAHGGQWRFFGRGVFAPGQGLWPKYTKGVYEGKRLVVSAGLANKALIPRLFNPTEVVYLEP